MPAPIIGFGAYELNEASELIHAAQNHAQYRINIINSKVQDKKKRDRSRALERNG
jgi:hypothetical protein